MSLDGTDASRKSQAHHSTSAHRDWVLGLLERHEAPLTRYARRLTGDLDTARDVVQHAMLRLCNEDAASVDNPRAWLYTVVHHRALDLRRRTNHVISLDAPVLVADDCVFLTPADRRELDPADVAELRDSGEALQRLVDLLPDEQRQVVNLWAEGFDYADISRIISRNQAYVRVLMHRALKQLRKHPTTRQLDPLAPRS